MNREQLAKECVSIEKAGGSVLDFLGLRGCISPWGTWYRLQKEELNRKEPHITDGKGRNSMSKITLEQKKKAVEIAISGGDPLEYLGECGSESPDKLWWYIKNCLKKAQPDLYAQIPSCRKKTEKKKDEPKTLDGSAWEPYPVEPVTGVVLQPQPVTDLKVETVDDDMKIYGLTTKVGDFQMAGDKLRWINPEDNEHIYITVDTWKQLLEIVPRVLQRMKL